MRRLLIPIAAALLTGCNAISTSLVLSAASSLPGAYDPPRPECEGCDAVKSEVDQLADRVPKMMEESRKRAGPDATATRTGYFSWEVRSPRISANCNATRTRWRCDRELAAAFSQQL